MPMIEQDEPLALVSNNQARPVGVSWILERFLATGIALSWRWGNDRQAIAALISRYSAHFAILALALVMGIMGQLALTQVSFATAPEPLSHAAAEPVATPTVVVTTTTASASWSATTPNRRVVVRRALPHTDIPERVRLEVITYTIQSGDTIFTIAEKFQLSPYTIAWANMEPLQGTPWLIRPGLTLFIPPVDGAYHTVSSGETVSDIAEQYEVSVAAVYNQWNEVTPDTPVREGMMLVIPGGTGKDVEWEAPPPPPSQPGVAAARASWGACGGVNVSGPGAAGYFVLPTGSYAVSGWYFGDPRNPGHIGLDYKCSLGDAIYAADNGVVVFAGWGGGYGNLVRVQHGNGFETYYAHFDSIYVSCGQAVYQGQVLGACGTTGWSTGPHLHYEIRLNGVPQNPQLYEP